MRNSLTIVAIPPEREPVTALYEVLNRTKHELPIDARVTIGRAWASAIRLFDSTVSLHHCVLEHVDGVWWIEDRGSANGTFLNDIRVSRAPLQPGMRLGLGRAELHVLGRNSIIPLTGKSITSVYVNACRIYGSLRAAAEKLKQASGRKKGPSHMTLSRAQESFASRIRKGDE